MPLFLGIIILQKICHKAQYQIRLAFSLLGKMKIMRIKYSSSIAAVKQVDGQTAFPSSICGEQVWSWFLTLE